MGTRAIYTFCDQHDSEHVFIHYDGYPTGAATYFERWLNAGTSWPLPRFEADEAAAGFVAAVKDGPGNVRICSRRDLYADVEFGYTVEHNGDSLQLTVSETNFFGDEPAEAVLWQGPMSEFISGGVAAAIEAGETA